MLDGAVCADGQRSLVGGVPALRGNAHPEVAVFGGELQQQQQQEWLRVWPSFDKH